MKPLISREYTGNQLLNPNRKYIHSTCTDISLSIKKKQMELEKNQKINVIKFAKSK